MRVAGWIFLAFGAACILLFAVLAMGPGDFRPHLLSIGISAVILGGSMRGYARATSGGSYSGYSVIVENTISGSEISTTQSGPTIELPMTPSAAAVIRAAPRKGLAVFGIVLGFVLLIALTISFTYDRTHSYPGAPAPDNTVAVLVSVCFIALICLVMWAVGMWIPARRDLQEATYLRTSGPIKVVETSNGYFVHLADRTVMVSAALGASLAKLAMDWAVVDYSRHAKVIFSIWDLAGQNVFSAAGYRTEAPRISVHK